MLQKNRRVIACVWFCKTHLANVLQNNKAFNRDSREQRIVVSFRHDCVQSAESPIFDAPFWSENGVSCPHERNKIGDSVLWLRACCFVRAILQICYKRTKHSIERATHRRVISCVWFCKTHLANMLQNIKHSIERATHHRVIARVRHAVPEIPDSRFIVFAF